MGNGHLLFREQRKIEIFSKIGYQWNDAQPGEESSSHHNACNSRPQDKSHSEKGWRGFHTEPGFLEDRYLQVDFLRPKMEKTDETLEDSPDSQTKKHVFRFGSSCLGGDEYLGCSRSLRVGKDTMLFDDQCFPERNHEQNAQESTHHG